MTHSNFVCGASGTYKPNSTYQKNLNNTLSALTQANNGSGFFTASSDTAQEDQINTVYALALCPGEFDNEGCTGCLNYATNQLRKDCPNQKKATGWYNGICMLSYSNSTFDMVDDDDNHVIAIWTKIIPDRDSVFHTELRKLFNQLVGAAATDGYNKAFYSDNTTLQDTAYIEGSMQCFPNISQNICSKCLANATNYLLTYCNGREQVVVYYRYFISVVKRGDPSTVIPFPSAPSMPPTTPQMILSPGKKRSNVIGPTVAAAAVTLIISTILICLNQNYILGAGEEQEQELFDASDDDTGEIIYFRLNEIQAATCNFSVANKLGEGGFGPVYWGELSDVEANTDRVVGTYGYMSPEYAMEGMFSIKSDVYSFGVLLLEIISGKRNSRLFHEEHDKNLLNYAWMLWEECKGDQLIDENVNDDCPVDQALKWLRIALLCIEEDPNDRPTMSSVVFMLEGEWKFLSDPKPPMSFGQFIDSDQSSSTWNGDKSRFYTSNSMLEDTDISDK
ncbi:hypothetical protein L2E82_31304 [Cichorium intybus]|uniref:Uncharacterized protein n=1 Tax=Cichorium intybus TaxID=13427 RepID=A0ACB9D2V9_CICIN|nr:hypothetical protein L2E82_31304 [Cichorium intybus]